MLRLICLFLAEVDSTGLRQTYHSEIVALEIERQQDTTGNLTRMKHLDPLALLQVVRILHTRPQRIEQPSLNSKLNNAWLSAWLP